MNTDRRTNDRTPEQPAGDQATGDHYEIRVSGRLGTRWASWFDGLAITPQADGTTVISGPIVDQPALHGLLQKLRDLGITLLSLTRITPDEAIDHPVIPDTPNRTTSPNPPGATS